MQFSAARTCALCAPYCKVNASRMCVCSEGWKSAGGCAVWRVPTAHAHVVLVNINVGTVIESGRHLGWPTSCHNYVLASTAPSRRRYCRHFRSSNMAASLVASRIDVGTFRFLANWHSARFFVTANIKQNCSELAKLIAANRRLLR